MLLIPAALLVRRRPPAAATDARHPAAAPARRPACPRRQALRSPQFIVLALTFFLCCAAHSGPIFHMVSYAMLCGIPAMAAVSIYSVEGLAGLGGRLLLGVLADRLRRQAGADRGPAGAGARRSATYLFVNRLGEFYVLAVIFGTAYGGVMPLYAVLAREYFGQHDHGHGVRRGHDGVEHRHGVRAVWPAAGCSTLFDSYGWLFIGSFGVGLGAVRSRSPSRRCRRGSASSCSRREGRWPIEPRYAWVRAGEARSGGDNSRARHPPGQGRRAHEHSGRQQEGRAGQVPAALGADEVGERRVNRPGADAARPRP